MAWDLIHIVRRNYHGDDNWGEMYLKTTDDKWEWLSYTYELPWKPDASGKSTSNVSRVKIGTYALTVREDGDSRDIGGKGWRLQLKQLDIATIFKFTALIQACISRAVFYLFISTRFLVTRFKKAIFV